MNLSPNVMPLKRELGSIAARRDELLKASDNWKLRVQIWAEHDRLTRETAIDFYRSES